MHIDHGWWRVALRDEQDRLLRLARTQRELARLLEAKLISGTHRLSQLEHTRAGILSSLDRDGGAGLVLYAATMRRLMDIGVAVKSVEVEIAEHNRTLLNVRLRQEAWHVVMNATRESAYGCKPTIRPRCRRNAECGSGSTQRCNCEVELGGREYRGSVRFGV